MSKEVTLSHSEQAICEAIAAQRYRASRDAGVKNSKIGDQSDEKTDLEGFAGEFAFCKLMNIMPDFDISVKNQSNDQGDCTYKGRTIDVKTTKYKSGRLVVAKWKTAPVDFYVLMVGEFPTYRLIGGISSKDVFKDCNLKDLGHGRHYVIEQSQLKKINP